MNTYQREKYTRSEETFKVKIKNSRIFEDFIFNYIKDEQYFIISSSFVHQFFMKTLSCSIARNFSFQGCNRESMLQLSIFQVKYSKTIENESFLHVIWPTKKYLMLHCYCRLNATYKSLFWILSLISPSSNTVNHTLLWTF